MNKISVVINTYNAEKFLKRVLESVKEFDEIVICDMESTDSTLEIASKYGCNIVTFPKKDYVGAEPARTFAIQSASHHWVFVVDADELVSKELHDYLYKFIEAPTAEGLYIPRKNYFMGKFMHCTSPDYLLRFFVKEGTVWPPYVHTLPTVIGRTAKLPSNDLNLYFEHLANDSVFNIVNKTNLYTENEVDKKRNKKYGICAMFFKPLSRFFKLFIQKKGFLDGIEGLIYAILAGYYQFVVVSKIIEKRKNTKRQ